MNWSSRQETWSKYAAEAEGSEGLRLPMTVKAAAGTVGKRIYVSSRGGPPLDFAQVLLLRPLVKPKNRISDRPFSPPRRTESLSK
jgi:hypothetical protein